MVSIKDNKLKQGKFWLCKEKSHHKRRVIKQSRVAQRGWGISIFGYFQDLTGEGLEQPHLAFKLVLSISGSRGSQASFSIPVYSSDLDCLGSCCITSNRVKIRLTRRWQSEQTKHERFSKAGDVLQPLPSDAVCAAVRLRDGSTGLRQIAWAESQKATVKASSSGVRCII